jgi:PilZ domain-containing protein
LRGLRPGCTLSHVVRNRPSFESGSPLRSKQVETIKLAENLLPELDVDVVEPRPLPRYTEMQSAPRFPLQLPVEFRCPDGPHAGETRNISANGVLLQVDSEVPIGSAVEFVINMPSQVLGAPADVVVNCRGRVVRCFAEQDHRWVGVVIDEYGFERR